MVLTWQNRFVAYVEVINDTEKSLRLQVRIPRAMADKIASIARSTGKHQNVVYRDVFAGALSDLLESMDVER